ncbi:hypothetical protein QR680_012191 [Steinernema hermaphroditum]|uniref:Uncharacterized protein n=1 Tax=Steinernema hermaphroditum TaxID=289476 RepID=A0AA39I3J7_9BILA|nr:hypothetical protein QR680_012191 [Steinernema hermaphroditum]
MGGESAKLVEKLGCQLCVTNWYVVLFTERQRAELPKMDIVGDVAGVAGAHAVGLDVPLHKLREMEVAPMNVRVREDCADGVDFRPLEVYCYGLGAAALLLVEIQNQLQHASVGALRFVGLRLSIELNWQKIVVWKDIEKWLVCGKEHCFDYSAHDEMKKLSRSSYRRYLNGLGNLHLLCSTPDCVGYFTKEMAKGMQSARCPECNVMHAVRRLHSRGR